MMQVMPASRLTVVKDSWIPDELQHALRTYNPRTEFGRLIKDTAKLLPDYAMAMELLQHVSRIVVIESSLSAKVFRSREVDVPWTAFPLHEVKVEDYGVVGRKSITDAGVGFLVDAWQNIVELEIMKYHGLGTGTTAEAVTGAGSALVTELTTEYNPDNTRATGSLTEGATALVFRSVGTNTLDGTPGAALREHALVSLATGAPVTWDRTLFAAITLSSGDGLQTTYDMTGTSGG